jgi:hypothetical protein
MSSTSNNFAFALYQAQFMAHGLMIGDTPLDTICSICTELCAVGEDVVKLIPCQSWYFHLVCIMAWFTSSSSGRGTCPNDRTVIFTPGSLASAPTGEIAVVETPNQLCEGALRRHVAFMCDQNAVVETSHIITAWQVARDSGSIARVRADILTMRRTLGLAPDVGAHYRMVGGCASADFIRLCLRFSNATKQDISTRMAALGPCIEAMQRSRPTSVYKDSIRFLLEKTECATWHTVQWGLGEAAWIEVKVRKMHVGANCSHCRRSSSKLPARDLQ